MQKPLYLRCFVISNKRQHRECGTHNVAIRHSFRTIIFGDNQHRKAERESDLRACGSDTFPVFIFLPGILGSKLSKMKNGKETIFWGKFSLADFVSDNPDFAYNKNEPVLASPLDTFYALRKDIDVYGNAFAQLKAITGTPKNVLLFSYDWRQSNIASASDFSKWLCKPEVSSIIQNH